MRHEQTQRIYDALGGTKRIPRGAGALTALAKLLNESPQLVKNWDVRGPSDKGLVALQTETGLNATWVRTGEGALFINTGNLVISPGGAPEEQALSAEVNDQLKRQPEAVRDCVESIVRVLLTTPLVRELR